MRTHVPITLCILLLGACSGSASPPTETVASPPARIATQPAGERGAAAESGAFDSGGMRCLHAPDGALASCEEISAVGVREQSAQDNCAMLGARLEPGACPTENVIGRCLAMDGPDLQPVYPIRIHYYRGALIASSDVARGFCAELDGAFTPVP